MPGIHLHTPIPLDVPKHRGERRFAQQLLDLLDENAHVWFGLDFIPGVNDIDALLLHAGLGAFVVEVKAVGVNQLVEWSLNKAVISGRFGDKHPIRQAGWAQMKLIEYLHDLDVRPIPFFFPTVALPMVSRRSHLERFGTPAVARQAEGLIFAEDLASRSMFLSRLETITRRPSRGAAPTGKPMPIALYIGVLEQALSTEHQHSTEAFKPNAPHAAEPAGGKPADWGVELTRDRVSANHARAWARWTVEEDARLLALHRSGCTLEETAITLERRPSAIASRMARHLGLLESDSAYDADGRPVHSGPP